jgi:hypothetical protein
MFVFYCTAWVVKMEELKKVDVKAWEWLMGHDPKLWCKHAFSYYPKCDVLMNNISEAFNATILLARDKPVLTMAEWIRTYLMNRMSKLRNKLSNWQGDIMPMPRKRLNTKIQKSGNWIATWGIGDEFEVEMVGGGHRFTVNTANRTCSCNFWELVGIPCRHAVAAIGKRDGNPEDFVHECYSRKTYEACYSHNVSAINGQDMWPEVECEEMLPPIFKKGPGRPKKLRRREPGEASQTQGKYSRANTSYRCTTCNKFGHNARGCKSQTVDPEAQKRKVPYYFVH